MLLFLNMNTSFTSILNNTINRKSIKIKVRVSQIKKSYNLYYVKLEIFQKFTFCLNLRIFEIFENNNKSCKTDIQKNINQILKNIFHKVQRFVNLAKTLCALSGKNNNNEFLIIKNC